MRTGFNPVKAICNHRNTEISCRGEACPALALAIIYALGDTYVARTIDILNHHRENMRRIEPDID